MITYRLGRTDISDKGIIGNLYRMDELICFTLEPPPDRDPFPAIPVGTYPLLWGMSPRLHTMTPRLGNVPGRDGILIHAGNTIHDTEGCILVGAKYTKDPYIFLYQSAITKAKVYQLIGFDLGGGGFAEIEVRDETPAIS